MYAFLFGVLRSVLVSMSVLTGTMGSWPPCEVGGVQMGVWLPSWEAGTSLDTLIFILRVGES